MERFSGWNVFRAAQPDDKDKKIQKLEAEVKKLREEIGEKNRELKELKQEIEKKNKELEELKQMKQETLKFSWIKAGNCLNSDQHFINCLSERSLELQETSVEESDVVLLFCPVVSRAGTDIEAALKKISTLPDSRPAVLVVLHHSFDLYRVVPDSSRSVIRANTLTVDCLFHEDRGLLHCQRNQDALDNSTRWIKRQVKMQARPLQQIKPKNKEELDQMKEEIEKKNKEMKQMKEEMKKKNKELEDLKRTKQEMEKKNKEEIEQMKEASQQETRGAWD